jgi:hypothetical protein
MNTRRTYGSHHEVGPCVFATHGVVLAPLPSDRGYHAADGTHVLRVDIPDIDHDRQIMDIHPARDAERLEDRNYTIVPALTGSSMCHRIVSHPEPGNRLRQQELHDTFIDVLNFLDRIATGGLPVAPSRATI